MHHFALTEEQRMLRESAVRLFEKTTPKWSDFAEMGWLGLLIDIKRGGIGGTVADAAVLAQAFGHGLVAAPYVTVAGLCAPLLCAAPATETLDGVIAAIAEGTQVVALAAGEAGSHYGLSGHATQAKSLPGGGWHINGAKAIVVDGGQADVFILAASIENERLGLFLIDADMPGISRRTYRTIDRHDACDLKLENVSLPQERLIVEGDLASELLHASVDRANVLLAAEAIGAMEAAMALAAEHIGTREQFGRTLSSYQVLTHRLADMHVRLEHARSMLMRGLAMLEAQPDVRAAAVSATMVHVIEAGEFVCGQAIQLHGGLGMSEESQVGQYYKRLRAIGRTYGDARFHLNRYIAHASADAA
ncbi:acyl-CoA dehydrogenase family protein [Croceicoccus estronivorus]|uniref:acyl-CoA dehydrogenase family protein n=1 Tax=Croceicoccus estronivorus TaxID=1172626 RepID=UPI000AB72197|nr:acyl-CoA dehydrogenase family protein [Croceicoccus estronivorus]